MEGTEEDLLEFRRALGLFDSVMIVAGIGHFHRQRGDREAGRLAGLVTRGVGRDRAADDWRRAQLWRTGRDDAAGGRHVCLSP